MFTVPAWLLALVCGVAALSAVARSRRDRRANGYIGHALALAWLGVVYLALQVNWHSLNDNLVARALAVRLPLLVLLAVHVLTDLIALWHARRAGGRNG